MPTPTSRASVRRFNAGFGRLPSRVRAGSTAYYGKSYTQAARQEMAAIIKRYEDLIRHLEGATPTIVHNALMPAFNRSQVYVPKKTGKLMESGQLRVGTTASGKAEGEITYGGPGVQYAAIVHEATWLNHMPPTSAKYLQRALEEELDTFMSSILIDYSIAMGLSR